MSNVPQTLKGFRDFLPSEKKARDYITQTITTVVKRFGFEPLETPTLEYASLLLGKYGDEADKLVYTFTDRGDRQVGLRYDQTVPTARVLSQYQNDLPQMFRRYQIQNVFRADKPQKGRFREFTQCDLDIYGSTSPLAEAEIIACIYQIFTAIGFKQPQIIVNDRENLFALLTPYATAKLSVMSLIQSLDKLDKLPESAVIAELVDKGLSLEKASAMMTNVKQALIPTSIVNLIDLTTSLGVPESNLVFSPTLARGLDYYTGTIFEIMLPEFTFGSFGGGGRYDNLIRELGGPSMPAVGVGLGFDRIVEAAKVKQLIPESVLKSADVLVTIFDQKCMNNSLKIAASLRKNGLNVDIYPQAAKLAKQLKYADKQGLPLAIVLGPEEIENNQVVIKDLTTGKQKKVDQNQLVQNLQLLLETKTN